MDAYPLQKILHMKLLKKEAMRFHSPMHMRRHQKPKLFIYNTILYIQIKIKGSFHLKKQRNIWNFPYVGCPLPTYGKSIVIFYCLKMISDSF